MFTSAVTFRKSEVACCPFKSETEGAGFPAVSSIISTWFGLTSFTKSTFPSGHSIKTESTMAVDPNPK